MPNVGDEVDEQPDLDAPALDERHRLEQRRAGPAYSPASGCTNSVRCGNSAESTRPGHQLGDAPAAGRLAVQRAAVVALHEADGGVGEQRPSSRVTKCGRKLRTSASSQHDDVALAT